MFRGTWNELLNDFLVQMNGAITKEEAIGIFNYLVVAFENLKTENGKTDFYLPIGKRRTRDTRFELKPLVKIKDNIVFSPITMNQLKREWLNGIIEFVLPYEIGMKKNETIVARVEKIHMRNRLYMILKMFLNKKNMIL